MRVDLPRTWPDYYAFQLTRVVDGDTIRGRIMLPFDHSFEAIVRLKEWYADEPEGHFYLTGREAKSRLEKWFEGRTVLLQSNKPRLDRYGRVLARLWSEGRVWTPHQVLGSLALTKQEHARRLQIKRQSPSMLRAAQSSTLRGAESACPCRPDPFLGALVCDLGGACEDGITRRPWGKSFPGGLPAPSADPSE